MGAFILGILLAEHFPSTHLALWLFIIPFGFAIVALVVAFFCSLRTISKTHWSLGLLLLGSFSAGYLTNLYERDLLYDNAEVGNGEFTALVADSPQRTEKALRIPIKILQADSLPQETKWMLYLYGYPESKQVPQIGDTLTSYAKEPCKRGEIPLASYRHWLRSKNCTGTIPVTYSEAAFHLSSRTSARTLIEKSSDWRSFFLQQIGHLPLEEEQKAFVAAIALGYQTKALESYSHSFRAIGTAHILAVSGFHLGVVCGFIYLLLGWLRKLSRLRFLLPLTLVLVSWGYVVLTGCSAPTVRAALMVTLYQATLLFAFPRDSINLLAFAALLLLLFHPGYLLDIGFQLSFLSVLSILLFLPFFSIPRARRWHPLVHYLYSGIALCISAQLLTFPLVLYHFGTVPLLFVWSNIPLVFLASLIIPLSLVLATPLLSFFPLLEDTAINILRFLLECVAQTIQFLSPWSDNWQIAMRPSSLQVVGMYLALTALYLLLGRFIPPQRNGYKRSSYSITRRHFRHLSKAERTRRILLKRNFNKSTL